MACYLIGCCVWVSRFNCFGGLAFRVLLLYFVVIYSGCWVCCLMLFWFSLVFVLFLVVVCRCCCLLLYYLRLVCAWRVIVGWLSYVEFLFGFDVVIS